MYSIELYPVFYEYKNGFNLIILYPRKAVYNTMRKITILSHNNSRQDIPDIKFFLNPFTSHFATLIVIFFGTNFEIFSQTIFNF